MTLCFTLLACVSLSRDCRISELHRYCRQSQRDRVVMLSSDCGCPLRVKVHLTHDTNHQPQAHQLRLVLASLTISSTTVILNYPPPIQKVVRMQGIGAHTVNLSLMALNAMSGMNGRVLGPEDLQLLKVTVCELYMHCFALFIVPEWLGELVYLRVLHLDGEWSDVISNRALIELPETLQTLRCLQSLTLISVKSQSPHGNAQH